MLNILISRLERYCNKESKSHQLSIIKLYPKIIYLTKNEEEEIVSDLLYEKWDKYFKGEILSCMYFYSNVKVLLTYLLSLS